MCRDPLPWPSRGTYPETSNQFQSLFFTQPNSCFCCSSLPQQKALGTGWTLKCLVLGCPAEVRAEPALNLCFESQQHWAASASAARRLLRQSRLGCLGDTSWACALPHSITLERPTHPVPLHNPVLLWCLPCLTKQKLHTESLCSSGITAHFFQKQFLMSDGSVLGCSDSKRRHKNRP